MSDKAEDAGGLSLAEEAYAVRRKIGHKDVTVLDCDGYKPVMALIVIAGYFFLPFKTTIASTAPARIMYSTAPAINEELLFAAGLST